MTTGTALAIGSTGTITSGGQLLSLTANTLTTGNLATLSATGMTSGAGISFTGPSGGTAGITGNALSLTSDLDAAGELINLSGTVDAASGTSSLVYSLLTNSPSAANTAYGYYLDFNDAAAFGNTNYGYYVDLDNTGASSSGTKAVYGVYSDVTNTGCSGVCNQFTYGGYFKATGDMGGTPEAYGIYASASGAGNNYGGYFSGSTYGVYANGASSSASAVYIGGSVVTATAASVYTVYNLRYIMPASASAATLVGYYDQTIAWANTGSVNTIIDFYANTSMGRGDDNPATTDISWGKGFYAYGRAGQSSMFEVVVDNYASFYADAPYTSYTNDKFNNTYGLYIASWAARTGTTTTGYGIYIGDLVEPTTAYPIYQAGTSGTNVFGADIVPLSSPSPAASSFDMYVAEAVTIGGISMTIGRDGFPVFAYYDDNNDDLSAVKCNINGCDSNTLTDLDTANSTGQYPSIAIGTDGYPIISYYDVTDTNLQVIHCTNASCSTFEGPYVLDGAADNAGQYTSIAIGVDGFPIISYYDVTSTDLNVAHCTATNCSASTVATVDTAGGTQTSIAIGVEGRPIISYHDTAGVDLEVAKCNDIACAGTNETLTTLDASAANGNTSIAIAPDGLPVISYYDSGLDLSVVKCLNTACSGGALTPTLVDSTNDVGLYNAIAIGKDGLPIIAYYYTTGVDLRAVKCGNDSCSSGNTITDLQTDGSGWYTSSIAILPNGLPVIAAGLYGFPSLYYCGSYDCSANSNTLSGGVDLGSLSKYWENVYAARFWGKSFQITAFDIAEEYPTLDTSLEAGDVVSISQSANNPQPLVERSSKSYDPNIIGIVSTEPGVNLGSWEESQDTRPVALAGRVPVKVSTENGPIEPGDPLTSSSTPGVAMRACGLTGESSEASDEGGKAYVCKAGPVVGKSLEPFNGAEGEIGKIMVFVNVSYFLPEDLLEKLNPKPTEDGPLEGLNSLVSDLAATVKQALASLGLFIENGVAQIQKLIASVIETENLKVGSPENPTGITIYDRITGQPYCVYVEEGQTKTSSGECDQGNQGEQVPGEPSQTPQESNGTNPENSVKQEQNSQNQEGAPLDEEQPPTIEESPTAEQPSAESGLQPKIIPESTL